MSPYDVLRQMPLRSSFVESYLRCPRMAFHDATAPRRNLPSYFLGGQVMATATHLFYLGHIRPAERGVVEDQVITILRAHHANGEYLRSADSDRLIVQRSTDAMIQFMEWFIKQEIRPIASEVTLRHPGVGGMGYAGAIDLIAMHRGDVVFIDHKTHGMWGKSISVPKWDAPSLRRKFQLAFYAIIANGGRACSCSCPRTTPNDMCKCPSLSVSLRPKRVGYIELASFVPYVKEGYDGHRGVPMTLVEFDESQADYAKEVAEYVGLNVQFKKYPRVNRYDRGQDSCEGCAYAESCWSANRQPATAKDGKAVVPTWMR